MTVRLSCNDYAWPLLSHGTVLSIISDLGFDGVDIGVFAEATHVKLSTVRADALARAEVVGAAVRAAGLCVADVFLTSSMELDRVTPTSRHPGDVDELTEIFAATLDFAEALGAPGVTLLPGVVAAGQAADEAIDSAAEGLAPLVRMGAARELAVSVEPHFGSCIETPEATVQLLDRCPGLSITLDPSHYAYVGCTAEQMTAVAPRTRHVQIRPAGPGIMQCKVPDNQVDLGRLFSALRDNGYSGWIASEFVWMEKWRCDEVDNTSESKRLHALLTEILAEVGL
jgi:sugar phosphate isomerase/epimerase